MVMIDSTAASLPCTTHLLDFDVYCLTRVASYLSVDEKFKLLERIPLCETLYSKTEEVPGCGTYRSFPDKIRPAVLESLIRDISHQDPLVDYNQSNGDRELAISQSVFCNIFQRYPRDLESDTHKNQLESLSKIRMCWRMCCIFTGYPTRSFQGFDLSISSRPKYQAEDARTICPDIIQEAVYATVLRIAEDRDTFSLDTRLLQALHSSISDNDWRNVIISWILPTGEPDSTKSRAVALLMSRPCPQEGKEDVQYEGLWVLASRKLDHPQTVRALLTSPPGNLGVAIKPLLQGAIWRDLPQTVDVLGEIGGISDSEVNRMRQIPVPLDTPPLPTALERIIRFFGGALDALAQFLILSMRGLFSLIRVR
jgi:hypothetical protein